MGQLTLPSLRKPLADFLTLRELPCRRSLTVLESRFERFKPEPDPLTAGGGAVLDCGSGSGITAKPGFPGLRVYQPLQCASLGKRTHYVQGRTMPLTGQLPGVRRQTGRHET